jgi:hypothetical protein
MTTLAFACSGSGDTIARLSEALSQRSLCCNFATSYFYLVFRLSARRSICAAGGYQEGGSEDRLCPTSVPICLAWMGKATCQTNAACVGPHVTCASIASACGSQKGISMAR